MKRSFHLGDILSITTERLVAPRRIEAVYDLLNWMTGDNLFTHQLPRAADECKPHLLAQHPDLAEIEEPEFPAINTEAAVARWLNEQVARFGEYRDVTPLGPGLHRVIDPLAELHAMRPDMPVIAVLPSERES